MYHSLALRVKSNSSNRLKRLGHLVVMWPVNLLNIHDLLSIFYARLTRWRRRETNERPVSRGIDWRKERGGYLFFSLFPYIRQTVPTPTFSASSTHHPPPNPYSASPSSFMHCPLALLRDEFVAMSSRERAAISVACPKRVVSLSSFLRPFLSQFLERNGFKLRPLVLPSARQQTTGLD